MQSLLPWIVTASYKSKHTSNPKNMASLAIALPKISL